MNTLDRELIEEKIKGVHSLIGANFDVVNDKLESINVHLKASNNRTSKLERQTEIVRFFTKYPKLFILFIVALFGSIYRTDIYELFLKLVS